MNLAAIVPLVAIVIALGLYPQFVVHRTEKDTTKAIMRAGRHRGRRCSGSDPMSTLLAAAQVKAPVIDYKELSPLFALAGGSVIVLMVGLFRSALRAAAWSCRCSRPSRCSPRSA